MAEQNLSLMGNIFEAIQYANGKLTTPEPAISTPGDVKDALADLAQIFSWREIAWKHPLVERNSRAELGVAVVLLCSRVRERLESAMPALVKLAGRDRAMSERERILAMVGTVASSSTLGRGLKATAQKMRHMPDEYDAWVRVNVANPPAPVRWSGVMTKGQVARKFRIPSRDLMKRLDKMGVQYKVEGRQSIRILESDLPPEK
jgi:hypothetical protein